MGATLLFWVSQDQAETGFLFRLKIHYQFPRKTLLRNFRKLTLMKKASSKN